MEYETEAKSPGNSEGSRSERPKRLSVGDTHCTASLAESPPGKEHWPRSEPMGSGPSSVTNGLWKPCQSPFAPLNLPFPVSRGEEYEIVLIFPC